MRIQKSRFYIMANHPGISGFQQWDKLEYRLVTGHRARRNRYAIVGEWLPTDSDMWALENGRLPEYQATARNLETLLWLESNPFSSALYVQTVPPRPYFTTDPHTLVPRVVTGRALGQDSEARSFYDPHRAKQEV